MVATQEPPGSGFHFYLCSGMGLGGIRLPPSLGPLPQCSPPLAWPAPPPTSCGATTVGVNEPESWVAVSFCSPGTWQVTPSGRSPYFRPVSGCVSARRSASCGTLPLGQGMSATRAVKGAGLMEQMGGLRQPLAGPLHRPCRGGHGPPAEIPGGTAAMLQVGLRPC